MANGRSEMRITLCPYTEGLAEGMNTVAWVGSDLR